MGGLYHQSCKNRCLNGFLFLHADNNIYNYDANVSINKNRYQTGCFSHDQNIPVNLSFQVALATLLNVITPFTVSFRLAHVVSKSTLLGFNDIFYVFLQLKLKRIGEHETTQVKPIQIARILCFGCWFSSLLNTTFSYSQHLFRIKLVIKENIQITYTIYQDNIAKIKKIRRLPGGNKIIRLNLMYEYILQCLF